jgi:hypothetical protein
MSVPPRQRHGSILILPLPLRFRPLAFVVMRSLTVASRHPGAAFSTRRRPLLHPAAAGRSFLSFVPPARLPLLSPLGIVSPESSHLLAAAVPNFNPASVFYLRVLWRCVYAWVELVPMGRLLFRAQFPICHLFFFRLRCWICHFLCILCPPFFFIKIAVLIGSNAGTRPSSGAGDGKKLRTAPSGAH